MQTNVETIDSTHKKITITIPGEKIENNVDKEIASLKNKVKIPGFRPGKTPLSIIRKKYSSAVRADIIQDLIRETYAEAIGAEKIQPASMPTIDSDHKSYTKGDFTFNATVEVFPEIPAPDFSNFNIEIPKAEVSEDELSNAIQDILESKKTFKPSETPAKKGDRVNIDFVGTIDGTIFEGGDVKDFALVIGDKNILEDFSIALTDAKIGDNIQATINFPAEYPTKHLAGQKAEFSIVVNDIESSHVPELTSEFVKEYANEDGNIDTFKVNTLKQLEHEYKRLGRQYLKNQTLDAIAEQYKNLEVPPALVEEEVEQMKENFKHSMQSNSPQDDYLQDNDLLRPAAIRKIRAGIVLQEIIKSNKINLDQDKFKNVLIDQASGYEDPKVYIDYIIDNEERRKDMEAYALEIQAIDFMVEQSNSKVVKLTFEELSDKISKK